VARFEFRLPDIGEGIAEAEIVGWHVMVGDRVSEDQAVADLMTDKATVEMESPVAGIVVELAGGIGDRVAIGSTLLVIETEKQAGDPAPRPEHIMTTGTDVAKPEMPQRGTPLQLAGREGTEPPPDDPHRPVARPLASLAVRTRARDLGVDLARVKVGVGRRIRHADLDAFLSYGAAQGYRPAGKRRADETIRVVGMRRRIAESMSAAKRNIPHFTYVEEIDVSALEAMRRDLNAGRGDRPKLTMMPFLIVAICKVLPEYPMVNARFDDNAGVVTRHGSVHLGMATQTGAGLMVPVIRDAQDRNIWQLADEIVRLATAARAGKARSEELSGSTLTITSLGPLGGIASTPVINRPEVAIIAPNRVFDRPVVRDGGIVAARLMNLSISCDHRVVDGWDAASFVQAMRRLLETPVLLFADHADEARP
jgi:2-oxoisovalerate dehydrogenase E2 component (dihydrolipoyl transacylase)